MFVEISNHPYVLMVIAMICLGISFVFLRKVKGLKSAQFIIENQFKPIDKGVIEEGFRFFQGDELTRYKTLIVRIRTLYGHEGVKVGHMAWIMQIMNDESIDVHSIEIPTFKG
jgi:hypothetical protein